MPSQQPRALLVCTCQLSQEGASRLAAPEVVAWAWAWAWGPLSVSLLPALWCPPAI